MKYILLLFVLLGCRARETAPSKVIHDTMWLAEYKDKKYAKELRASQAYFCDTLFIHDTIYRDSFLYYKRQNGIYLDLIVAMIRTGKIKNAHIDHAGELIIEN